MSPGKSAPNPSGTLIGDERFAVYYADTLAPVIGFNWWKGMHLDMAMRVAYEAVEKRERILVQTEWPDTEIPDLSPEEDNG